MNDPHVRALLFRVEHSPFLSYEQLYEDDLPEFRINIEGDQATVEPKAHFATAEEAQAVVEPFLRTWELDACLRLDDPKALRFVYLRPDIVDQDPPPGTLLAPFTVAVGAVIDAVSVKRLDQYPAPPSGLAVEPGSDVEAMFKVWGQYKAGQARLGDTADFCRGALEKGSGRQAAGRPLQDRSPGAERARHPGGQERGSTRPEIQGL
jgi:hypothetical protein